MKKILIASIIVFFALQGIAQQEINRFQVKKSYVKVKNGDAWGPWTGSSDYPYTIIWRPDSIIVENDDQHVSTILELIPGNMTDAEGNNYIEMKAKNSQGRECIVRVIMRVDGEYVFSFQYSDQLIAYSAYIMEDKK